MLGLTSIRLKNIVLKTYLSLTDLHNDLQKGKMTCRALVQHYLNQITAKSHLNAFLEVFADEALERADQIDQKIANKQALGRLYGMPIGIKDVLCYKNHQVTAASRILDGFESIYTATAVERLLNEDAIILGRLNCDEFAMGSTNENSAFGVVRNAYNPSLVPGGSSGGSAVAVQAGLCLAALGSDTGGSVRQPASFCGVVGLKPTYGRISRHGLIAYASSFDQIGPLTHNVADAALLFEVMAGKDAQDATTSAKEVPSYSPNLPKNKKLRIAYLQEAFDSTGLDPHIKHQISNVLAQLKADGHTVEPVAFPYLDYIVPTYYILTTAEASSNLARYDGIRYGHHAQGATDTESTYRLNRSEGFGWEVKKRIMLGTFVLSAGYYDAYYSKAQKVRRLISQHTEEVFTNYDFIVTPTTPTTAFAIGDKAYQDPIAMYLADIFTVQANIVGIPAISLPLFRHPKGMPFGLQVMGKRFAEADLLTFGNELMQQFV